MNHQTIKKNIEIRRSKERVWEVLQLEHYQLIWYAEFSEGSHAQTDWKEGNKVVFTDNSNSGLIGKIIDNKPGELLALEYQGVVVNGMEDYESDGAKGVKGGRETYRLSEENGITHLAIDCDMSAEFFDSMSKAWESALQKIKQLAESPES